MKKLAILTLLAAPAFAHQVPYSNPTFLKLTKGDAVKAQGLSWYCESSGRDLTECAASLSGSGNLGQEAALNCQAKFAATALSFKIPDSRKEAPAARAHQAQGVDWHLDYKRDPEDGEIHRHVYSDYDRKKARDYEIRDRVGAWRKTTDDMSGDLTVTKTVSTSVGVDQGLVTQIMNLLVRYDTATATEMSKKSGIPESVLKEIYEAGQAAFNNPAIADIKPTIVCIINERDCRNVPEGENKTNTSYDPNAEKDRKEEKKA